MAQPTYTLEELSRKVDAISEFLNEKTDRNLLNLNTVGQAIIDGKVEVEALLEQNGYAKFTWKEDNKVASLLINWLKVLSLGNKQIATLPSTYNKFIVPISGNSYSERGADNAIISPTLSTVQYHYSYTQYPQTIVTIGY